MQPYIQPPRRCNYSVWISSMMDSGMLPGRVKPNTSLCNFSAKNAESLCKEDLRDLSRVT